MLENGGGEGGQGGGREGKRGEHKAYHDIIPVFLEKGIGALGVHGFVDEVQFLGKLRGKLVGDPLVTVMRWTICISLFFSRLFLRISFHFFFGLYIK